MKRRRHTPERAVRKVHEGERLLQRRRTLYSGSRQNRNEERVSAGPRCSPPSTASLCPAAASAGGLTVKGDGAVVRPSRLQFSCRYGGPFHQALPKASGWHSRL